MENINTALMLMAVGMGTVFLILFFIIYFSKGLIVLINKYVPEDTRQTVSRASARVSEIPAATVAAITAAVNAASGGRARVTQIDREK